MASIQPIIEITSRSSEVEHNAIIINYNIFLTLNLTSQRFIPEKNGSKNGFFTKIGDLKTDSSQKLETLKRTLQLKIIM